MTRRPPDRAAIDRFHRQGFLRVPALADPERLNELRRAARAQLAAEEPPVEREAEVGYPGAPAHLAAPGGRTVRRLLQAWDRGAAFRAWATDTRLARWLRAWLGSDTVYLSRSHHNCIMTKMPRHSSATHWHRDIRYWSFSDPELITAWLALGSEREDNGSMRLIPGSHRLDLPSERFDEAQFLRPELPENDELIAGAARVELEPGDVLFFHARTLHAAGPNRSNEPKLALVFTYHDTNTRPLPDTRSSALPEIEIGVAEGSGLRVPGSWK